jgi:hypothetical protein
MWGSCLDASRNDSPIRQILIAKDRAFPLLTTHSGTVDILQLVGVTVEEVEMSKNWKCSSLLEIFMQHEK